jgi:hypothetical protein
MTDVNFTANLEKTPKNESNIGGVQSMDAQLRPRGDKRRHNHKPQMNTRAHTVVCMAKHYKTRYSLGIGHPKC